MDSLPGDTERGSLLGKLLGSPASCRTDLGWGQSRFSLSSVTTGVSGLSRLLALFSGDSGHSDSWSSPSREDAIRSTAPFDKGAAMTELAGEACPLVNADCC